MRAATRTSSGVQAVVIANATMNEKKSGTAAGRRV
jgi:hypothetical protein